jgi:hypothetical protein
MLSKFFCHLFLRFEYGQFCDIFVSLTIVEDFVESCCFSLLVVLIPILFVFSLVLMGESTF